jgi:NADPH:quinone reductase-like Zn-dependent oxidoreductase
MRAIVYERYGGPEVLEVRELPSPFPTRAEVLVAVEAAALNPKDSFIRKGKFRRITGSRFPRRLGFDVAGVVRAVGEGVTRLEVGDEVFGMKNGWEGGTVAEEVCLLADELALKPKALTFEQAAAVPLAGLTALQALRDEAQLQPGQRVLINGGSGGVGVFAIQVARALGAHVVTTSSARNLELCRSLGAHEAWDYATQPGLAPGAGFDVFFDVFGNRSFREVRPALAPRGTYVSTVPGAGMVLLHFLTRFSGRRARLVVVKSNGRDLEQLARWLEAGTVNAVVDRALPLAQAGAGQAHLETKRARGKVVVRVGRLP